MAISVSHNLRKLELDYDIAEYKFLYFIVVISHHLDLKLFWGCDAKLCLLNVQNYL